MDEDQIWLRTGALPSPSRSRDGVRIIDLFSGCGGMSLGMWEAARRAHLRTEIPLAVDLDTSATAVYTLNFPDASVKTTDVRTLFDGDPGDAPTRGEQRAKRDVGAVDVLLGGPPCQGHSDLNNHTRRNDPKNALYLTMARAAEVLEPTFVVIENVPTVQHDVSDVVSSATTILEKNGYSVDSGVFELILLGVPQRRRRHLLLGSLNADVDASAVLNTLLEKKMSKRHVRWAIGDLQGIRSESELDRASRMSEDNKKRVDYLFDNDEYDLPNDQRPECHQNDQHSYKSMYGRLSWNEPAQTITTGFTSMGQGRFVHPAERRTLTPHEAARLQTFPDWFSWGPMRRTALSTMIGNAVPPLLMLRFGEILIPAIFDV